MGLVPVLVCLCWRVREGTGVPLPFILFYFFWLFLSVESNVESCGRSCSSIFFLTVFADDLGEPELCCLVLLSALWGPFWGPWTNCRWMRKNYIDTKRNLAVGELSIIVAIKQSKESLLLLTSSGQFNFLIKGREGGREGGGSLSLAIKFCFVLSSGKIEDLAVNWCCCFLCCGLSSMFQVWKTHFTLISFQIVSFNVFWAFLYFPPTWHLLVSNRASF